MKSIYSFADMKEHDVKRINIQLLLSGYLLLHFPVRLKSHDLKSMIQGPAVTATVGNLLEM